MTPSEDEALWRNRFITINLVRIGGTAVVLLGLVILTGRPSSRIAKPPPSAPAHSASL